LVVLPNLAWQFQHNFISLDFLQSIHARDVRIGRTDGFLIKQLLLGSSFVTIPLAVAGLWFFFFTPDGERYRAVGWMFVTSLALFFLARGRDYYQAPAYPMLLAAGAVWLEQRVTFHTRALALVARTAGWTALAANAALNAAFLLPIAPVNSAL